MPCCVVEENKLRLKNLWNALSALEEPQTGTGMHYLRPHTSRVRARPGAFGNPSLNEPQRSVCDIKVFRAFRGSSERW